jgi:hypothetical protein
MSNLPTKDGTLSVETAVISWTDTEPRGEEH